MIVRHPKSFNRITIQFSCVNLCGYQKAVKFRKPTEPVSTTHLKLLETTKEYRDKNITKMKQNREKREKLKKFSQ